MKPKKRQAKTINICYKMFIKWEMSNTDMSNKWKSMYFNQAEQWENGGKGIG